MRTSHAGPAMLCYRQRSEQCATSAMLISAQCPKQPEERDARGTVGQVVARNVWMACCGVSNVGMLTTRPGWPSSTCRSRRGQHRHNPHLQWSSPSTKTPTTPRNCLTLSLHLQDSVVSFLALLHASCSQRRSQNGEGER